MADTSAASLTSYTDNQPNVDNYYVDPAAYQQNIAQRFGNWLAGIDKNAQYTALQNKRYLQYENDYNLWLDSTKYQRAVEDLKKAGLNPWLAAQKGIDGTSSVSSGSGSSAKLKEHKDTSTAKDLATSALKLGILLKVLASIA